MKLHVHEKSFLPHHLAGLRGALSGEKLLADLEAPYPAAQGFDEVSSPIEIRRIETDINPFHPGGELLRGHRPACSTTSLAAAKSSTAVPTDLKSVISSSLARPAWRPAVRSKRSALMSRSWITPCCSG